MDIKSLKQQSLVQSVCKERRCHKSFDDEVYQSFKCFDPKYWDMEDRNYGIDQIDCLYNHFEAPLNNSGFDLYAAKREWESFKKIVQDLYQGKCSRESSRSRLL